MKLEIINPSDPYTMEADDLEVAAVVIVELGGGHYGGEGIEEDKNRAYVPIFLFGGCDEWFKEHWGYESYGEAVRKMLAERPEALVRAFDSVTLGSAERSSLNDIGARAKGLARAVRRRLEEAS